MNWLMWGILLVVSAVVGVFVWKEWDDDEDEDYGSDDGDSVDQ